MAEVNWKCTDPAEEETCKDCKFRRFATNECHRHSPSIAGWPEITEDNWCGDFEWFLEELKP